MKLVKLVLLAVLLFTPMLQVKAFAAGDEAEELNQEMHKMQDDMKKVAKQLQDRAGLIDTSKLAKARVKMMELASDERFVKSLEDLWANPNRNTLLIVEGIFLVLMIIIKAWRQGAASNWFTRLLVGLFLSLVMWIGLFLVIPAIVLGEPFRVFVLTLWKVFVG